ncbi:hypothetical protein Ddye_031732 [Dipteronia dyeriana]|uniref:Uncharacterized protein n=1 Tax=Dipteronia dyeriana TaxID=168575 RepID=A0AAD9TK34_9ROSI|nr:hypothetical protein Ddye_031732 [Dipteronia dyeriana]
MSIWFCHGLTFYKDKKNFRSESEEDEVDGSESLSVSEQDDDDVDDGDCGRRAYNEVVEPRGIDWLESESEKKKRKLSERAAEAVAGDPSEDADEDRAEENELEMDELRPAWAEELLTLIRGLTAEVKRLREEFLGESSSGTPRYYGRGREPGQTIQPRPPQTLHLGTQLRIEQRRTSRDPLG